MGDSVQRDPIPDEVIQRVSGFTLKLLPLEQEEEPKPEVKVEPPGKVSHKFTFVPHTSLMELDDDEYRIEGVLPKAGLIALYGPSGCGKSYVALDMAGSIARGAPWAGIPTEKRKVAYIVAEGEGDFRKRIKAYMMHRNDPGDNYTIHVLEAAPNLGSPNDVRELVRGLQACGHLDIIFVDTLARTMQGLDENSAKDMGLVVSNCGTIHKETGATMVLIHHSGKNAGNGMRGSSALRAAADAELEFVRNGPTTTMTVTKMKGGDDGATFRFQVTRVSVGMSNKGKELTSLIVEHLVGSGAAPKGEMNTGENVTLITSILKEFPGSPFPDVWEKFKKIKPKVTKSNFNRAWSSLTTSDFIISKDGKWEIKTD
jgi:AAA domain